MSQILLDISDHLPIIIRVEVKINRKTQNLRKRDLNDVSLNQIKNFLSASSRKECTRPT